MLPRRPVAPRGPRRAAEQQSRGLWPPGCPAATRTLPNADDPACGLRLCFSRPTALHPVSTSAAPVSDFLVPSLNQTLSFPRGGVSPFPPQDGAPCVGADVEMMSGWCGQARGGRPTTSAGHACAAGPGRPARWPGEHAASPGLSHAPGLHPNLLSPPSPPAARPCQRRVPATSFYLLPIVTTRY